MTFRGDPFSYSLGSAVERYVSEAPESKKLKRISSLLAALGGVEAMIAGQLVTGLEEAETSGARFETAASINVQISKARSMLNELATELGSAADLRGATTQAIAGLSCVTSDSIV